ncbi:hypothetical protein OJAV_G00234460 [Oryzias javanicus]|uniref:Uncharacterized protein n=1 Tax=Oryzias javanicus TaxID=123683 RepID=A0A3S2PMD0_ORYJA|nr:hypothetical protein OJAV_G00234460 [Oryzias javanicus]
MEIWRFSVGQRSPYCISPAGRRFEQQLVRLRHSIGSGRREFQAARSNEEREEEEEQEREQGPGTWIRIGTALGLSEGILEARARRDGIRTPGGPTPSGL